MENITYVNKYSVLKDWFVHKKNGYNILVGRVIGSDNFCDGDHIHTSEIKAMGRFKEYILFQTYNSFYKCYKNNHDPDFEDLLFLYEDFPQFTKETFNNFYQEIQHLSTLNYQSVQERRLNLFPKDCKRGIMFLFDKHRDYYFDSMVIKTSNEEPRVEKFAQVNTDGKHEIYVYVPIDANKTNAICLFLRNEDGVSMTMWNELFGDVYVCNYSKDMMHFYARDQEDFLDQYQVIKIIDSKQ